MIQYTEQQFNDIQTVVKDNWLNIIRSIIDSRVSKISNSDVTIQLFLNTSQRRVHLLISDVITIHGSKALGKELESKKVKIIIIIVITMNTICFFSLMYSLVGWTIF